MSDLGSNKQLVKDFLKALGNYDLEALSTVLAENVVFNIPNSGSFPDRITLAELPMVTGMLAAVCPEGIYFKILELTAEADRVSARVEGRGAMQEGEYHNHYHFLFRISGRKIVETFEYMDSLLVEQTFGPMLSQNA